MQKNIHREILRAAWDLIQARNEEFVCSAVQWAVTQLTADLTAQEQEAYHIAELDIDYHIGNLLELKDGSRAHTLEVWLRENGHPELTLASMAGPEQQVKMRATRLAWITWMMENNWQ
ncbi:hypothetical protein H1O16_gp399 [Burkholderia phage BcepSaruman]|uniref:Uncharacterized protein n=1 Tax=Burkholderia phage BcepSaruman TaxID=2530032 RepID=A0A4D5ZH26_9CAUD|nr:hypothetical protein H1O16_gp399 [Burkholderia phage BcepSaruman]QBX06812.1 hypothetical protein BcepSaruman_399 [Burkholderia phage BcepSaruman]